MGFAVGLVLGGGGGALQISMPATERHRVVESSSMLQDHVQPGTTTQVTQEQQQRIYAGEAGYRGQSLLH